MSASRAISPPRPQRLVDRLPALAPAAAQLLHELFATPRGWTRDGLELRLQAPTPQTLPTAPESALLESAAGFASLWVASSDWRDDAGERPWQDYEGESRLLAWTLTHESLLARLGAVLACDFTVGKLVAGANASHLALRWSLREGGQRAQGWIKADPEIWQRHWLPLAQPLAAATSVAGLAATLRTKLPLLLPLPDYPLGELQAAGSGDVLVIGSRERAFGNLVLQQRDERGARRWLAAWNGRSLTLQGALEPSPHLEDVRMSDPATPPPSDAATAAAAGPVLDTLTVDLTLVVGSLSLSLAELAALAPGAVFELPNRLDQAQVLIQAGGRTVGRGDLVAVGDTLGVQLTELKLDGPQ